MSDRAQWRWLGRVECAPTAAAMQAFTAARTADTPDEIWLCEHAPVYTLGLAGKAEHLLHPHGIPVLQTNRGGQVTYHGPGQLVAYPLIDLKRLGIYVKEYVYRLEGAVLATLQHHGVTGHRVAGAPGVYVNLSDPFGHAILGRYGATAAAGRVAGPGVQPADDGVEGASGAAASRSGEGWLSIDRFAGLGKIAALGIKVSRNCSYHGVALNVAMDLRPFDGINPCGYAGLRTVDLSTIGVQVPLEAVADTLAAKLAARLRA